ncbi:MAG: galactokinase family protein, partial [Phycisphaerae bacterium]
MKMEPDTTVARPSASAAGSPVNDGAGGDWTTSPIVVELLARLGDGSPRFVARAPGRLDLMGGLAEYTGSLVLNMTIADHVCVGVQRRSDGELTITCARSLRWDGSTPTVIAMSHLHGPQGAPIDAVEGRQLVEDAAADGVPCVLGTLVEMFRAGLIPRFDDGLSIMVASTLGELADVGRDAALAAATMTAVAGECDATLDPLQAATICQRVENDWLQRPVGVGDAVCVLLGEPHTLAEVRCEPCTIAGSIRVPDELAVIGIDCGAIHPDAKLKFERVRTAAFMGRDLIDRIIRHGGVGRLKWDGYLSQISVTDYVERFRDRLPTKFKGSEYLARFGETGDPLTRIDPDFVYKIRSRTEHHIYEHARACQFVECLSRAIRNEDDRALSKTGELMYASHWSYGQRCGLGSVETDLLVNLIRGHGVDAGIYGAKATARGCGGVVAVLMRADDRAMAAVNAAVDKYQSKTGHKT